MNIEIRPADYDKVLLSMYAAVSDPEHFWETLRHFEAADDDVTDRPPDATILQHAERLNDLLELTTRARQSRARNNHEWQIDFDQNGRIARIGDAFRAFFPQPQLHHIWDLPIAEDDIRRLRRYVKKGDTQNIVVILPTVSGSSSRVAQVFRTGSDAFTLKVVQMALAPSAEALFAQNFGVSRAQFRVLQLLVAGNSVSGIADQLNRSVETVRSHIKALTDKLYVRSQSELVSRTLSIPTDVQIKPSHPGLETEGQVLEIDGLSVQYFSAGDASGQPVLYFQHATDGPFVTDALNKSLSRSGLRLISIARPGAGHSTAHGSSEQSYAEVSASLHHHVCEHLGVDSKKMLAVGTGLPHALGYTKNFKPDAEILAVNAFPPFLNRANWQSLPGRWSSYAYVARRAPFMVQPLVLVACQLFLNNPDKHTQKIVDEEIRINLDESVHLDAVETLKRNMHLNAIHQARHYSDEARLLSTDWVSDAREFCPDVKIVLAQGNGHFAISGPQLEKLASSLPNASIESLQSPVDPLHILHPDWICDFLSSNV